MSSKKLNNKEQFTIPQVSRWVVVVLVLLSLLIHLLSYISIDNFAHLKSSLNAPKFDPVKVNIKPKVVKNQNKEREKEQQPDEEKKRQIVETPLKPTEAPKEADFWGAQDHIAKKETKGKKDLTNKKAADPGEKSATISQNKDKKGSNLDTPKKDPNLKISDKTQKEVKPMTQILTDSSSTVTVPSQKPRSAYEKLLQNSMNGMQNQVDAGYQDYINGDQAEGDRIDLNTKQYRYIGYFSALRKAVELVWVYPSEAARRGIQGVVHVEFRIAKDGKVTKIKVLKSSNSNLLDNAIVQALKDASPFPPLPESIGKDTLTITGAFSYILNGYAGH